MQNCQDSYSTTFSSFPEIHSYHQNLSQRSLWTRCRVNQLHVEPLVRGASHFPTLTAFAPGTSETAVEDTLDHLGLAILSAPRITTSALPSAATASFIPCGTPRIKAFWIAPRSAATV